jgi:hypothetical protein
LSEGFTTEVIEWARFVRLNIVRNAMILGPGTLQANVRTSAARHCTTVIVVATRRLWRWRKGGRCPDDGCAGRLGNG